MAVDELGTDSGPRNLEKMEVHLNLIKADFQSVVRTLESLFTTFVLFHVRRHKM